MFKIMAAFILKEGEDPDKFFEYHTKIHAEDVKKAAGANINKLKKYTISRVTKVVEGDMKIYGLVEMWFEKQSDVGEVFQSLSSYTQTQTGLIPPEDFRTHTIPQWALEMNEFEVPIP